MPGGIRYSSGHATVNDGGTSGNDLVMITGFGVHPYSKKTKRIYFIILPPPAVVKQRCLRFQYYLG